jgi:hypothetical protein
MYLENACIFPAKNGNTTLSCISSSAFCLLSDIVTTLKALESLDLGGVCLDVDLERGSMAFQGVWSTNARASPAKHKRAQGDAYTPWGNVAIRSTWTVDSDGLSILQCTSRMQAYF